MKILDLVQGTEIWLAHRASARNASEAAAVLNLCKYTTRQELLRKKASGVVKAVDAATQRLFDDGHEAEDKARPVVADLIGEAVYPITATSDDDYLSASFDGVTMDESTIWENKLDNKEIAAYIQTYDDLPDSHWPQVEQQLMISKAERCLFTLFDKAGNMTVEHWYKTRPERQAQIMAAWQQFDIDLSNYQHVEVKAEATGKAPDALPALRIEVTGMVTASNLAEFKAHSLAVFAGINKDLQTDEDFATAEKTVKWCGDVESRLEAAKEHALSQTQSIDELFKTIDAISAEARRVRLDLDKQVKAQKENRRAQIVNDAAGKLAEHVASLNVRIGKPYMPAVRGEFANVIKGKKTITSLQDAADAELARCKILANEIADKIQINLNTLRDQAADYKSLFADAATIVLKNNDDLVMLIKARISDHEKELADKKERERQTNEQRQKEEAQRAAVNAAHMATVLIVDQPNQVSAPVQEVKPVVSQSVTNIEKSDDPFEIWFKEEGLDNSIKKISRQAFLNGYNIGYRHALDDKSA